MISICISAYGDDLWRDLSWSRAYPSTADQSAEVIVNYEREGTLASVRNECAEAANGDWLIFLDADDELAPGYVSAMETACRDVKSALLVPRVSFCRGTTRVAPRFLGDGSLRDGNPLIIGTMVPRELFFEVGGFDEGVELFEDWMLFAKLWKAGAEVVRVKDAIYVAYMMRKSRNRVLHGRERLYWHQWIGHAVFPDHYEATTPAEDAARKVNQVRTLA